VTFFESHVSEADFTGKDMKNFFVTGLLKYISAENHRLKKQNLRKWVFPLPSVPSCLTSGVRESHSSSYNESSVQELQLKEISRYKRIEDKSVEDKASGIGHGGREVGRNISSRIMKI
jgi:hypothetical protein